MFRFFCKNLVQNGNRYSTSNNIFCFCFSIQTQSLKSKSNSSNQQSLVVTYLINSCGLSLESAITASKKLHLKTTEKPDSVLELLRTHGFTKTHFSKLFTKDPLLLLASHDILKPKLEYFESLGISRPDLAKILSTDRGVLRSSLADHIIPNFDFIKKFVHTNENLIATFKLCSRIATCNSKVMKPNISTLQSHGVPEAVITKLIMAQPITLMQNPDRFSWAVGMVKKMGFVPVSRVFAFAVHTLLGLSSSNWEKKMDVYKSLCWSQDDILSAFRIQPNFMLTSEEKIRKMMNFFVNKLGLIPSNIARYPNLLLFSLEKRLIPRNSVIEVLKSKGLMKKHQCVISVLRLSKAKFEKKYVIKYQETVPEVIEAYQVKLALPELDDIRVEDAS